MEKFIFSFTNFGSFTNIIRAICRPINNNCQLIIKCLSTYICIHDYHPSQQPTANQMQISQFIIKCRHFIYIWLSIRCCCICSTEKTFEHIYFPSVFLFSKNADLLLFNFQVSGYFKELLTIFQFPFVLCIFQRPKKTFLCQFNQQITK